MFEDLIGMNSLQGRDMPPTTQEMMPTNRELLMKQQKGQLPARQDVTWDYDPLYGSEWFPQEMGRPMRPAAQAGLTPRTDMLKPTLPLAYRKAACSKNAPNAYQLFGNALNIVSKC